MICALVDNPTRNIGDHDWKLGASSLKILVAASSLDVGGVDRTKLDQSQWSFCACYSWNGTS